MHVDMADDDVNQAPRPVADCLIKVTREAIVNAAKHGGMCRISLSAGASPDGPLQLTVLDDGIGFRQRINTTDRYGLVSLRRSVEDAGGSFEVTHATDFGTRVTASFPG